MPSLRIDGATVVPMDGPAESPLGRVGTASLRIRGDRLTAVGTLDREAGENVWDATGLVALPGFVQTHLHYCQTLFRGLADDLPLLEWLQQRIWPLEAAHDSESVRASAELSVVELLRGGTTTTQVMETVHHTQAAVDVAMASGMTTVIGNCLMDIGGDGVPANLTTTAGQTMARVEQLHRSLRDHPRVHYAVSPRFVLSCSEGLARAAAGYARDHDLRIHTHAAEHPDEVAAVRRACGADYIAVLARQGLLGPRSGLAHCVHTSDAERRLLADTGTAVLHCPSTNQKLGSGIAPIAAYRDLGLRVGLGADGAPANNRLSALTELRAAALLQSLHAGPGRWPAEAALHAATLGGAEALGLADEVGSLARGKRADIVLFDLGELTPGGSLASQLVYSATEAHIRHVIAGGEFVVRDGEVVSYDPAEVRARAGDARRAVMQRAGLRA